MSIQDCIISSKAIGHQKRNRTIPFIFEVIPPNLQQQYEDSGWTVDKILKKSVRVKKAKPIDLQFEDEVWIVFANMGFTHLNKDRNFRIKYSADGNLSQQIDVFAADEETILFVECKATDEIKKGNFKEAIEAIGGKREGIFKEIRKVFNGKKYKIKFIFATKNYIVSEQDIARMKEFDIFYFNDDAISYYTDLSKHLGYSARYQLLGNLFDGQKIPEIENIIPAIEGTMGGHTYYSFSIEPGKLLKIGYVLHRNKANKKHMPTYQRLIKKQRLNEIRQFINSGGFFPNSIIVDIETNGNGLRFDLSGLQSEGSLSRIGLLHLPQKYKSAYIIDGQHRLYGYCQSKYMNTNTVPVIAFLDLKREEQVKLFMEINENQKAVPKNLRNTLNSDLLWDSSNLSEQRRALRLQIAQDLGEERSSPLFNRVIVGENQKTLSCCITIDTIAQSLNMSNFFSKFKGNSIVEDGTFDKGNNDNTYGVFFPFLERCFEYIRDGVKSEWEKGESDDGFLAINAGIFSLVRIFNDIVDHLVANDVINPKSDRLEDILTEMKFYLDPLIEFINSVTVENKDLLKRSYGSGGRTRYWRTLQRAISEVREDFNPEGLEQYIKDNANIFNEESFKIIRDIERFLKSDFRNKLANHYGPNWFTRGVPKVVYDEAIKLAADKNYDSETGNQVEPWDCLTLINYKEIAVYGSNWSDLFEKDFTKPGEEKIPGGKRAKVDWIQKLSKIRNENFHTYSVKEQEYNFLKELYDWLIVKKRIALQ